MMITLFIFLSIVKSQEVRFLQLTDIHYSNAFNIDYPNNWCQSPNMTEHKSNEFLYGMYGCNPPIELVDEVFSHAKSNGPYSSIIISGDICSHDLPENLYMNCLLDMRSKLDEYFVGIPIVFSMGNNDIPGNYDIQCSDNYFKLLAEVFSDQIPQDQLEIFNRSASYTRIINGQMFIVLNTNLFDKYSEDECGILNWFEQQLNEAEKNGYYPIVVGHIPPGVSINSLNDHYNLTMQSQLFEIIIKHSKTINSFIFGHTHREEFRLLPKENPSVMLSGLSVSPVYNNNPGYKILLSTTNRQHGYIDSLHFTMNLKLSNEQKKGIWFENYSYVDVYKLPEISVENLKSLQWRLKNDLISYNLYRWRSVGYYDENELQIKCALSSKNVDEMMKCTKINDIDDCPGLKE